MKKPKAVTVDEMQRDLLAYIAKRYDGRPLEIDIARQALIEVAHHLVMAHMRAVAEVR